MTLTDSAGPNGPTGGFSTGADGNDTLENIENVIGSAFNDTLTGNSLANSLRGGVGDDTIDGGAGVDFALYNLASSGVTVTLTDRVNGVTGGTSSGTDGNDTLRNIESIIGSQFDDVLTGNSENNGFNGGRGNDTLNGGVGLDTAFYSDATGSVTVTLRDNGTGFSSGADGSDTLVNIENLFGGEFDDTLTGNRLANSFLGRGGNDKIDGGGGFDTVNYFAPRSNYTITKVSPGTYTVTDITGRDGTDTPHQRREAPVRGEFASLDVPAWTSKYSDLLIVASTWQFFNGSIPEREGFEYLINSDINDTDLNDPYFSQFNDANKYIAFASNLAFESAQGSQYFRDNYDGLDFESTLSKAFDQIITAEAVNDPEMSKAFFRSGKFYFEQVAAERIVRAGVDISEATQLALIASMIYEAVRADAGHWQMP